MVHQYWLKRQVGRKEEAEVSGKAEVDDAVAVGLNDVWEDLWREWLTIWSQKCVQEILTSSKDESLELPDRKHKYPRRNRTNGNRMLKFGTNFMRGGGDVTELKFFFFTSTYSLYHEH